MSDSESEEEIVLEEEDELSDEEDVELTLKEQVSNIEKSIIRSKKIIEVPREKRRTSNYITKTELVEIIGTRAALIEKGAPAYTELGDLKNPIHIAVKEMLEGQNPQKIQRVIKETETEKVVEIWVAREMIANMENYSEIVPENIFEKIQEAMTLVDNFRTPQASKFNSVKTAKIKKGGSETTVPPIVYWYNGTQKERYNFDNKDVDELENFPRLKNNDTKNYEETKLSPDKRSEYEKLLMPNAKNTKKIDYYLDIECTYPKITRMLALIAAAGGDKCMVDIDINPENSLLISAIQVLKYYYNEVDINILELNKINKIRISLNGKKTVHQFYTRSLINLIDLPEVKSIFLISDLMKL